MVGWELGLSTAVSSFLVTRLYMGWGVDSHLRYSVADIDLRLHLSLAERTHCDTGTREQWPVEQSRRRSKLVQAL